MSKVKHICKNCGKSFETDPSRRNGKNVFCCHKCSTDYNSGVNNSNYVQKTKVVCEYCGEKMERCPWQLRGKHNFCSRGCHYKWWKEFGPKKENHPNFTGVETDCCNCGKKIIRHRKYFVGRQRVFCDMKCWAEYRRKNNIFNSKNEFTSLIKQIRKLGKMHLWKQQCIARDIYQCVICGEIENLQVHHKVAMLELIRKYNIKTQDEAHNCIELWDISNGITFCGDHHKQFHDLYGTYGFSVDNLDEFVGENRILKAV